MRLRNISPLGDLDVFGVGLVEAGAEFDVPDGSNLADQVNNFAVVGSEPVAEPVQVSAPVEIPAESENAESPEASPAPATPEESA